MFISACAEQYQTVVSEETQVLNPCIVFIDRKNLPIATPNDKSLQKVLYIGHKRFHALKYQAPLLSGWNSFACIRSRGREAKFEALDALQTKFPTFHLPLYQLEAIFSVWR